LTDGKVDIDIVEEGGSRYVCLKVPTSVAHESEGIAIAAAKTDRCQERP
jgi:hypothetical protein